LGKGTSQETMYLTKKKGGMGLKRGMVWGNKETALTLSRKRSQAEGIGKKRKAKKKKTPDVGGAKILEGCSMDKKSQSTRSQYHSRIGNRTMEGCNGKGGNT